MMNENEKLAYEMLEECTNMKTTTGKIIKDYYELTPDCAVKVMLNWYKKLSERQKNTKHSDNTETKTLHISDVSGSCKCPNCCSNNIIELANNHHKTKDKMKYLEYYECLKCGYKFVE